ncbi:hypothetical protein DNTS_024941, partial [Danionella cerebrum]
SVCRGTSRETMATDWKHECDSQWQMNASGIPMPDSVDWKSVSEKKPFERNLLQNSSPYGVSHMVQPPEIHQSEIPPQYQLEPEGNFSGWKTSTEVLPYDTSGIPPGVVICHLPQFRWFSLEQCVDLKAEGLYEESQLHKFIYQLDVKLLGADGTTVIEQYTQNPEEDLECYSHTWKKVSHVFAQYGPGVRYIHFVHRLKNKFMIGFFNTKVTDTSIVIKTSKSS